MTDGTNAATPAYAFPERALRRWRTECLCLHCVAADRCEAEFQFEGSTCGNVPFVLLYRVALTQTDGRWHLREMEVLPRAGDEGHREMCSAKSNLAGFQERWHHELPLLGRPLDECLTWAPATSPEGCLCAEPARAHKWRAVLQTLHHALHRPL